MSLYIFDRDGTLTVTKSGRPCPNELGDQEVLPGVEKKLLRLKEKGHGLAICSNQGGVSFGYMTEYAAWQIAHETNRLFGCVFDDIVLSCYHPRGKWRESYFANDAKPRPQMILRLMESNGYTEKNTCMIGNAFTDQEAAENAGVAFDWAHDFFDWVWDAVVKNEHGYHPRDWHKKWEVRNANKK